MNDIKSTLVPLCTLLASKTSRSSIKKALSSFECCRDNDVVAFLGRHAIKNEGSGASRSYLALDESTLESGSIDIIAFLTLAITVTDYSAVTLETRKQIMGDVPYLKASDYFPGFLIAQLARDDRFTHEQFDCSSLLVTAEQLIRSASESVGGRIIYLDCKEALIPYYENQGYQVLYSPTGASCLFKMFKTF